MWMRRGCWPKRCRVQASRATWRAFKLSRHRPLRRHAPMAVNLQKAMKDPNREARWYSVALIVLAIDQAAKAFIDLKTPLGWSLEVTTFFNLVHVLNPGAAFSFLAGAGGWQRWFFMAIALGASIWLAWMLARPARRLEALAYSLILGGALGNAFDRAARGQVIDYLDFHVRGVHWPAFNVADMAITGGAVALVAASLLGYGDVKPASPRNT